MGQELARLYDAETRPALGGHRAPVVQLARGDFLADGGAAWADADLVLINSCCFSDETFRRLERVAAEALEPGTIVVTVRRQFRDVGGGGDGDGDGDERDVGVAGGGGASHELGTVDDVRAQANRGARAPASERRDGGKG